MAKANRTVIMFKICLLFIKLDIYNLYKYHITLLTFNANLIILLYMNSLIAKLISGIIGIGISAYFLPGVTYDGNFKTIILVGLVIGLLMYFVRPILSLVTLPLRIITLNLFSIIIMMFLVWLVDCLFPADMFEIFGINNIFFTTLIIWGTEQISSMAFK